MHKFKAPQGFNMVKREARAGDDVVIATDAGNMRGLVGTGNDGNLYVAHMRLSEHDHAVIIPDYVNYVVYKKGDLFINGKHITSSFVAPETLRSIMKALGVGYEINEEEPPLNPLFKGDENK